MSGLKKRGPSGRLAALVVPAMLATACNTVPSDKYLVAVQDAQAAKERVSRVENQLSDEQKTVKHLQNQVATARHMSPDVMKELTAPVRIELASQSGGYTKDNQVGDQGIVLYVQPIDSDGDVIKATGSFRATLLDLTEPTSPKVISPYEFDIPNTRKLWYGRFMTTHYTLRLPWPPGPPPKADKITAVVEFTDLLTGRVLTTQKAFDIKHAPIVASQPK
jgi:hypothetical protein